MSDKYLITPWRIRFHLRRTGHVLVRYNPFITVPMFDPSARGIYAKCSCQKEWAL